MNQVPKRRGRPPKSILAKEELIADMSSNNRQFGGTHYVSKTIQPWSAMQAWMSKEEFVGFLRGNTIKYLARCNDKGGIEDIKKAHHYLEKLIEVLSDPS